MTLATLNGAPQDAPTRERTGEAAAPVVLWHEAKVLLPTRVFEPPDLDPEKEHTLIVAFHGYGASAERFGGIVRSLADRGFLVAVPESGYPFLAGQKLGFEWFPEMKDPELGKRVPHLLFFDQVPAMLADLKERYSIDRVHALGFSEGAVASLCGAVFLHEDFAGAVQFGLPLFSPDWLPGETVPEGKDVRLLFLRGENDQRVPLSTTQEARSFFENAGYETTFHAFPGGHAVPRDQLELVADWIGQ